MIENVEEITVKKPPSPYPGIPPGGIDGGSYIPVSMIRETMNNVHVNTRAQYETNPQGTVAEDASAKTISPQPDEVKQNNSTTKNAGWDYGYSKKAPDPQGRDIRAFANEVRSGYIETVAKDNEADVLINTLVSTIPS